MERKNIVGLIAIVALVVFVGGKNGRPVFSLETGPATFRMTHDGDSKFTVTLLDFKGNKVELLADEMGKFAGTKVVDIKKQGYYMLDVDADDKWKITVEQPPRPHRTT